MAKRFLRVMGNRRNVVEHQILTGHKAPTIPQGFDLFGMSQLPDYSRSRRIRKQSTSNVQLDFIPPKVPGFPTEDESRSAKY
jgi:hypothetical protein